MRSRLLFVVLSGFLRRPSGLEPISASFSLDAFRGLHTAGVKVFFFEIQYRLTAIDRGDFFKAVRALVRYLVSGILLDLGLIEEQTVDAP